MVTNLAALFSSCFFSRTSAFPGRCLLLLQQAGAESIACGSDTVNGYVCVSSTDTPSSALAVLSHLCVALKGSKSPCRVMSAWSGFE